MNMSVNSKMTWAALAIGAALATPAAAELSSADVGKLGATLTPVGGEKAGNAAGTIPAWAGGNGVVGCTGGIPFPIPKNGTEAIWNTLLRYSGDTFAQDWAQAAVTRTGDYALVKFEYEYDFSYGNCSKPVAQREANKKLNY